LRPCNAWAERPNGFPHNFDQKRVKTIGNNTKTMVKLPKVWGTQLGAALAYLNWQAGLFVVAMLVGMTLQRRMA
jgi:hypothetical protein